MMINIKKELLITSTRCTPMDKLYIGIMFATKKLRHYLLYYTMYVIIPINPLKYLLQKKIS